VVFITELLGYLASSGSRGFGIDRYFSFKGEDDTIESSCSLATSATMLVYVAPPSDEF